MKDKKIVSVGAGNEHSIFVTAYGTVLVSGYNDNGQCGIGSILQVKLPSLITIPLVTESTEAQPLIKSVHVNNGCEHTILISNDGKVFSCGYNYRGQVHVYSINKY
jgi:alpha-tubulin suppressor-like RCC1 family protein